MKRILFGTSDPQYLSAQVMKSMRQTTESSYLVSALSVAFPFGKCICTAARPFSEVVRTIILSFLQLCDPLKSTDRLKYQLLSERLCLEGSCPIHQHLWCVLQDSDLQHGSLCGLYSDCQQPRIYLLFPSPHPQHCKEPLISATWLLLIITLVTSVPTKVSKPAHSCQHTGNRHKHPVYEGRWILFLQR